MRIIDFDAHYRKKLSAKRLILSCYFELTNRCNLNCRHCYIRVAGKKHEDAELSFGQIRNILNQMADNGVIYLTLTGGEPLLRPDFNEIYLFAKKKKLAVSVVTNATLLTRDTLNLFKEYPPLKLQISNYGMTPGTYEYITRARGSFRRYQNAIEMLKKTNIRFSIRSIVMKSNYREILLFKDTINKSGMNCECVLPFILRRDSDNSRNAGIKNERLSPVQVIGLFSSLKRDFLKEQKTGLGYSHNAQCCNAGTLSGNITADGKLTVCPEIYEPNSDLTKVRFADAWRALKSKKTPAEHKMIACGDCSYADYCSWCPGAACLETGSREKRIPYLCKVMQAFGISKAIYNG